MTRVRRREARSMTDNREWQSRRSYVLASFPDLECMEEFWRREDGIPEPLREHVIGYAAWGGKVLAPDPERYIEHLEARRRWLRDNEYPYGTTPLVLAEPVR